jgi:hypothetical protein
MRSFMHCWSGSRSVVFAFFASVLCLGKHFQGCYPQSAWCLGRDLPRSPRAFTSEWGQYFLSFACFHPESDRSISNPSNPHLTSTVMDLSTFLVSRLAPDLE